MFDSMIRHFFAPNACKFEIRGVALLKTIRK